MVNTYSYIITTTAMNKKRNNFAFVYKQMRHSPIQYTIADQLRYVTLFFLLRYIIFIQLKAVQFRKTERKTIL